MGLKKVPCSVGPIAALTQPRSDCAEVLYILSSGYLLVSASRSRKIALLSSLAKCRICFTSSLSSSSLGFILCFAASSGNSIALSMPDFSLTSKICVPVKSRC